MHIYFFHNGIWRSACSQGFEIFDKNQLRARSNENSTLERSRTFATLMSREIALSEITATIFNIRGFYGPRAIRNIPRCVVYRRSELAISRPLGELRRLTIGIIEPVGASFGITLDGTCTYTRTFFEIKVASGRREPAAASLLSLGLAELVSGGRYFSTASTTVQDAKSLNNNAARI